MASLGVPTSANHAALKILLGQVLSELALMRTNSAEGANNYLQHIADRCERSVAEMTLNIGPGSGIDEAEFREAVRHEILEMLGSMHATEG